MTTTVAPLPKARTVFSNEPRRPPVVAGINDVHRPAIVNRVWTLTQFFALRFGGVLIAAALYFLMTQTYAPITNAWHSLTYGLVMVCYAPFHPEMTDQALRGVANTLRHAYRDNSEGFAAAILPITVVWNHFKRWRYRKVTRLDQLEQRIKIVPNLASGDRLRWYQLALLPVAVLAIATCVYIPASITASWLHSHPALVSWILDETDTHDAWRWISLHGLPKDAYQMVAAYIAGMVSRRPIKAAADKLQLSAAIRHYHLQQPFKWYHTLAFRNRVALVSTQEIPFVQPNLWHMRMRSIAGWLALGLVVALAAFGGWVLIVPAHHLLGW